MLGGGHVEGHERRSLLQTPLNGRHLEREVHDIERSVLDEFLKLDQELLLTEFSGDLQMRSGGQCGDGLLCLGTRQQRLLLRHLLLRFLAD